MPTHAAATATPSTGTAPLVVTFADTTAEWNVIYETGTSSNTVTESGAQPNTITEGA